MMDRLALLCLVFLGACANQPLAPAKEAVISSPQLDKVVADNHPATLGVYAMELGSKKDLGINADRPMPMQSVFKLPLAIFIMDAADKGGMRLDERITLTPYDISVHYSPISEAFPSKKDYTLEELVRAVVVDSDNAAADLLLKRIGGPPALTRFFKDRGIGSFRLDRYEYELQPQTYGLTTTQFANRAAYIAERNAVPIKRQRAAIQAYLADPRDTVSARDMVRLLTMLDGGKMLSPASTAKVMRMMEETTSAPGRIKAAVPDGATLYHKTGTGATVDGINGASNDVGIVRLPDGRKIAMAVFFAGSTRTPPERDAVIADTSRLLISGLAPGSAVP